MKQRVNNLSLAPIEHDESLGLLGTEFSNKIEGIKRIVLEKHPTAQVNISIPQEILENKRKLNSYDLLKMKIQIGPVVKTVYFMLTLMSGINDTNSRRDIVEFTDLSNSPGDLVVVLFDRGLDNVRDYVALFRLCVSDIHSLFVLKHKDFFSSLKFSFPSVLTRVATNAVTSKILNRLSGLEAKMLQNYSYRDTLHLAEIISGYIDSES